MYAALFEMTSWMGCQQYIFKGNTASDLLSEFERVQDLGCLVRMGRGQENKKGQKFLSVCKAIEEILTGSEEWKALPEYEFLYD